MLELTSENFEREVIKSAIPCLVDFWAPWCGPCKMMTPVLEEIEKLYKGTVKFCKLNVDDNPDVASRYGIMSIPTLLFMKNGNVDEKIVGAMPRETVEEKLKIYLK